MAFRRNHRYRDEGARRTLYGETYRELNAERGPLDPQLRETTNLGRVRDSALYLSEVMGTVPAMVIPCLESVRPVDDIVVWR